MWTVVYIAASRPVAEMMERRLTEHGLMAKIRESSRAVGKGNGSQKKRGYYEVLVPESEAEDAQEVVSEALRLT